MKNLVECCNEALQNDGRTGAKWEEIKAIDKKIREYEAEKKKDKDYKVGNPYNTDFQIEYHDGDARIKVGSDKSYYAIGTDTLILKGGDCTKRTKVLVVFTQLLSREEGTKEAVDLFDTTNNSTRKIIGRALERIWYDPKKDQLYDANFKKVTKPGKAKSEAFETLFCGFIAYLNPKTQYTKEWFSK